ncbi:MAG: DUF4834 domain-containing protein [Bacteroidetes bacterium]|nr:MAG: DUF4834 domain-containing protein [Bacteroidota bacterium]
MFKFLLILFLIGYLFFKIGGFLFRLFLGRTAKAAQERQYKQNNKGRTTKEGLNIDHVPNQKGKRTGGNFKGGEYVDYEEL